MLLAVCLLATVLPSNVQLAIQPDEARAVLSILDERAAGTPIRPADWQRLFATEAYVRLKQREHSMKRAFEDDDFRRFVLSEALLQQRAELHRVVDDWSRADLAAAAERALAYLPAGAPIRATIYPVIKPLRNSFVFEGNAIFLHVADEPRAAFETTIAHELHHIGYNAACPQPEGDHFGEWITAFGEGLATLAAGGGPDHDPQRYAKPDVQKAWAEGMRDYDGNFHQVESFFLDIAEGRLKGDAIPDRGFQFFGLVGPWYTVGWKMCAVIEQTLERPALIEAFCRPRTLFAVYNRAAALWEQRTGEKLPRWDERLVEAAKGPVTQSASGSGSRRTAE